MCSAIWGFVSEHIADKERNRFLFCKKNTSLATQPSFTVFKAMLCWVIRSLRSPFDSDPFFFLNSTRNTLQTQPWQIVSGYLQDLLILISQNKQLTLTNMHISYSHVCALQKQLVGGSASPPTTASQITKAVVSHPAPPPSHYPLLPFINPPPPNSHFKMYSL